MSRHSNMYGTFLLDQPRRTNSHPLASSPLVDQVFKYASSSLIPLLPRLLGPEYHKIPQKVDILTPRIAGSKLAANEDVVRIIGRILLGIGENESVMSMWRASKTMKEALGNEVNVVKRKWTVATDLELGHATAFEMSIGRKRHIRVLSISRDLTLHHAQSYYPIFFAASQLSNLRHLYVKDKKSGRVKSYDIPPDLSLAHLESITLEWDSPDLTDLPIGFYTPFPALLDHHQHFPSLQQVNVRIVGPQLSENLYVDPWYDDILLSPLILQSSRSQRWLSSVPNLMISTCTLALEAYPDEDANSRLFTITVVGKGRVRRTGALREIVVVEDVRFLAHVGPLGAMALAEPDYPKVAIMRRALDCLDCEQTIFEHIAISLTAACPGKIRYPPSLQLDSYIPTPNNACSTLQAYITRYEECGFRNLDALRSMTYNVVVTDCSKMRGRDIDLSSWKGNRDLATGVISTTSHHRDQQYARHAIGFNCIPRRFRPIDTHPSRQIDFAGYNESLRYIVWEKNEKKDGSNANAWEDREDAGEPMMDEERVELEGERDRRGEDTATFTRSGQAWLRPRMWDF